MNGPSFEGSYMLANIWTMPISVPIIPQAGADRRWSGNLVAFVQALQEIVAIALDAYRG